MRTVLGGPVSTSRGDVALRRARKLENLRNGDRFVADPIHGSAPLVLDETAGRKAYCQCGLSAKLPYCDGTHSREGTGLAPVVVEVPEDGKKAVCQCHRTGNSPWCDGTHSRPA